MLRLNQVVEERRVLIAMALQDVPSTVCGFVCVQMLGSGSFGKVYLGVNNQKNRYAIKVEKDRTSDRLMRETLIYYHLQGGQGIPKIHWFGTDRVKDCTMMAMDVKGPSLDKLFRRCYRRFSLKTVLMLAVQLLNRLEYIHSKCYVHRDVKPANFVMGHGHYNHLVYMIDYGLAARFQDESMQHIPNRDHGHEIGTPLFASWNSHLHMTPSRRDDMESLAYMLIYFLQGSLPWEGLNGKKGSHKSGGKAPTTWEIIGGSKFDTPIDDLCQGLPVEFGAFLLYCRELKYEEEPNYEGIRCMFRDLARHKNIDYNSNYEFDWSSFEGEEYCMMASSLTAAEAAASAFPDPNSVLFDIQAIQMLYDLKITKGEI